MYRVLITSRASKTLEKATPALGRRLSQALQVISENPFEGKRLHGKLEGLLSLRVGEWRVVYEIDVYDSEVVVHSIGPRGQIYRS